ncbi:MAG: hypothetical protein AB7O67_02365 [Vicinamibacterales bacterium]
MSRISLSQARAGHAVVRPVVNNNGVVLVQAGAALTDGLIDRLRTLGVSSIVVAGEGPSAAPRSAADRIAELDHRFAGVKDEPLMAELYTIVRGQIPESEG